MKVFGASLLAVMATLACIPAQAQFAKSEDAIEYRQGALFVMGNHFGRIGAMANGKIAFDAKAVADNAAVVETLSKLPWAAFGPGTETGHNTKAKPEVWTDSAKFKEALDKFQAEIPKFVAAAKTATSAEALKPAFTAVGGACKNCHDNFRAK